MVPGVRPAGAGPHAEVRRHRDHGQSRCPQEHKSTPIRNAIEAVGVRLLFLPPYSPDINPIENAFAKLKALLRKAAARSIDQLWEVIARIIQIYSPRECANYFAAAGYDAD